MARGYKGTSKRDIGINSIEATLRNSKESRRPEELSLKDQILRAEKIKRERESKPVVEVEEKPRYSPHFPSFYEDQAKETAKKNLNSVPLKGKKKK